VVIVSEERGEVSLALSGKLERMETAQQLSTRLTELLFTPVPEAAHLSLVRRMTRNFWPKLATFALVFVCWLVITARQGEITTIAAPVQFHNLPDSLLLGKSSLDSVELQLKTISSLIPLPKEGDVVADIDLSRMQEGNNQVLFRKEDFKLPSGVVITRIKPAGMRVVIEKRMRKLVRVEARFTGAPADNLRLKRYKVSPSMVMVEGPASILSQLESLRTEEISLDVPAGARTMEKRLAVPAQLRALYDDQVKVRIVIGK
jgi:YbbR domain-containing protein